MTSGQTYLIELKGSPTDHGTLIDTTITGIYDSDGDSARWTSDDNSTVGRNAKVTFTPTSTGTYYIEASAHKRIDWDGTTVNPGAQGSYTLFLSEYRTIENDDCSNFTDTTGQIAVGSSVEAEIEAVGDRDWFAMHLVADRTYRIQVTGAFETWGQLTLGYGKIYGIYDIAGKMVSGPVDE